MAACKTMCAQLRLLINHRSFRWTRNRSWIWDRFQTIVFSNIHNPCMFRLTSHINPSMLLAPKSSLTILMRLAGKGIDGKIFYGEMLIKTLPKTLLQIVCNIIVNSKVIVKSILVPDDNCWRNSEALIG